MTGDLTLHMGAFEWTVESGLRHVKRRFANPKYIHLVAIIDDDVIDFTGVEMKSGRTAYMMKG